jgi:hypothetical protein
MIWPCWRLWNVGAGCVRRVRRQNQGSAESRGKQSVPGYLMGKKHSDLHFWLRAPRNIEDVGWFSRLTHHSMVIPLLAAPRGFDLLDSPARRADAPLHPLKKAVRHKLRNVQK